MSVEQSSEKAESLWRSWGASLSLNLSAALVWLCSIALQTTPDQGFSNFYHLDGLLENEAACAPPAGVDREGWAWPESAKSD